VPNLIPHIFTVCCSASLVYAMEFGAILGFAATFWVFSKSDVIFLLGDCNFLQRWRNFAPISLIFRDLTQDRQTDGRQTWWPFH